MNFNHFLYDIKVSITLTVAECIHIMQVGASHYDARCRYYAKDIAKNWIKLIDGIPDPMPSDERKIYLEWSDLDTICKIMEMEKYYTANVDDKIVLADKWFTLLQGVNNESERINAHWRLQNPSRYPKAIIEKLNERYGPIGEAKLPLTPPFEI